jgi:hypothetical protein
MIYLIYGVAPGVRGQYWSAKYGWTGLVQADQFTEADKAIVGLPYGGIWLRYLP